MTNGERQCCGRAMTYLGGHCSRPACVTRDGKRYCYQHDPERMSEKRAERAAKSRAEVAAREARLDRQELERDAGISALTDDDLRAIIAAGGIRAMLAKAV